MLRQRKITVNFFKDDVIASVSIESRFLLIGLWCMADSRGVLINDIDYINCQLPYVNANHQQIEELLCARLITRTATHIVISDWDKWQPGARRDKQSVRKSSQTWRERNKGKASAVSAHNRASRALRSVAWADKAKIQEFYEEAKSLTLATGVPYEVDHILPLKGRTVSGLHVHNNLQVITADENRRKHNIVRACI